MCIFSDHIANHKISLQHVVYPRGSQGRKCVCYCEDQSQHLNFLSRHFRVFDQKIRSSHRFKEAILTLEFSQTQGEQLEKNVVLFKHIQACNPHRHQQIFIASRSLFPFNCCCFQDFAQVLRVGHIVTIFVDFSVLLTADSNSLEYIVSRIFLQYLPVFLLIDSTITQKIFTTVQQYTLVNALSVLQHKQTRSGKKKPLRKPRGF